MHAFTTLWEGEESSPALSGASLLNTSSSGNSSSETRRTSSSSFLYLENVVINEWGYEPVEKFIKARKDFNEKVFPEKSEKYKSSKVFPEKSEKYKSSKEFLKSYPYYKKYFTPEE